MAWSRSVAHGGSGGDEFNDDLTPVIGLAGFNVRSGKYVDAIQPVFLICGNEEVTGQRHGGGGGDEHQVRFVRGEEIVTVEGRSGKYVDQLTFVTNKKTYGPYGGNGGKEFQEGQLDGVGGFFGRSGKYLDQVGFFRPC